MWQGTGSGDVDLTNVSVEAAVRAAQAQEDSVGTATQVLRECLEANYDRLLRRLSRSIGCQDTASDSLHEAWVRLGSATLPEAVHKGETYVFRMAYNLAVDQMRGRRMWASLADENEVFDVLPDHGPGPEAVAGARSELAALARALGEMSGHHRRVLVELRIDDLTREEVAARHGLSLRKVDTLLRQTLDYCAEQTGRQAAGGITASRRPARLPDASEAIKP
ncbi:RNA polymerase sigma factor [Pandoraea sputorum]|uniref:ECF subfamily RNA polymerase sigma factor n=1 Tax=Pandoraea sputorum TaxID=93222 RepID=A0A5E5BEG3_9BURK|nr:RNA polymerase sigma factor [Pandoraea sputorum]VVE83636.1 ECF subfamily RNA polymerase sigma factor [Pandoraea sputorum]